MNRWYTNLGLRHTAAGLDAVAVAAETLRSDEGG